MNLEFYGAANFIFKSHVSEFIYDDSQPGQGLSFTAIEWKLGKNSYIDRPGHVPT